MAEPIEGVPGSADRRVAVACLPSALRRRPLRRFIGPKRVLLLTLLAAGIVTAWQLRRHGIFEPRVLRQFLAVRPVSAVLLFALVYAASIVAMLPTAPLNLAAGLFWGPVWGGLIATAGAGAGSLAAFYAARALFGQPLAQRFDNRLVALVQQEFAAKGWRFVAFARLNPVVPTGPLNYLLGLTSMGGFAYVWVTFAFLLPPSLAVALIGHEMGTFAAEGETARLLGAILIISAAVTALFGIRYGARLLTRARRARDER